MKIKIPPAVQLALIFLLFGVLWIILTDELSYNFTQPDIGKFVHVQLYKGILFITVFSLLIYFVSNRFINRLDKANEQREDVLKKNHVLEIAMADQKLHYKNEVAKEVIEAQEAERKKIGEELHDNINQLLGVVKLYIEHAQNTPAVREDMLKRSVEYLLLAITEIRALSKSLVSPTLADLGLIASINELIENIFQIKNIRIILKDERFSEEALPRVKKLMIYRILQELLNNVLKHSKAEEVIIELWQAGKVVQLSIQDNGVGFDMEKIKLGTGLNNIRNRLEVFNGEMKLHSECGKGCRLEAVFEI